MSQNPQARSRGPAAAAAAVAPPPPSASGPGAETVAPAVAMPAPAAGGVRPAYANSAGAPAKARVGTWVRGKASGTPGRMRLFGALAAIAAIVFGLAGAWNLWSSAQALGRAGATTDQVVRVQSIYADVLRADADASNAFLVGGLEDPAQRADYEAAIKRAATTITAAASAQPADGVALAALNSALQDYAALVERARAENRQGLPIGVTYMTSASSGLRTTAVPILEALLQANTERSRGELGAASSSWPTLVAGVLAVLVLGLVSIWLARRTHRYLNSGLAGATVAVLVALIFGLVVFNGIGSDAKRVADNQLAGTLALTSARTAAFDARANESLGLIRRGQAGPFETLWKARDAEVTARLKALVGRVSWYGGSGTNASALIAAWAAYEKAHAEVRTLDDGGSWDAAVAKATTATESPRTTFDAFQAASATAVDGFQSALTGDIEGPTTKARIAALVLLLAGLAAAVLSTRGIAQRVEEYR
ncbi:MAG TPA: hypothetical protein PLK64_02915 [Dermatophilaceae bacterium]|nr:hypothetical protein [Dermatophilaceae bacterium]